MAGEDSVAADVRPRLLDLFCGAGGAAMGYYRAGFEVVGVDIKPQPHYPFEFIRDDAFNWLIARRLEASGFVAIHASPPCQAFTALRYMPGHHRSEDLLTPTRFRLQQIQAPSLSLGWPYIIENVPGAPMRPDVVLCGSMFGLQVWRHRWFEFSDLPFALIQPCVHTEPPVGVYGHPGGRSNWITHRESVNPITGRRWQMADWRKAMDIDWMTAAELSQAIPPAYTEWIGRQLMAHLERAV